MIILCRGRGSEEELGFEDGIQIAQPKEVVQAITEEVQMQRVEALAAEGSGQTSGAQVGMQRIGSQQFDHLLPPIGTNQIR